MKARVAMFQRGVDSTWTTTWSQPQYTDEGDAWTIDGYTRITEWVDVEFPALPPEVIVPAQIAALDGLAPGPATKGTGDPFHHRRQFRVAQIEREAGEAIGGGDRRQSNADRGDRHTGFG